jgi:hypothetical protein
MPSRFIVSVDLKELGQAFHKHCEQQNMGIRPGVRRDGTKSTSTAMRKPLAPRLAAQHKKLGELMLASAKELATDPRALARVKKQQF